MMKEFRAFLLSRTGWQDENGNNIGDPYALMTLSYEKEGKTLVVT